VSAVRILSPEGSARPPQPRTVTPLVNLAGRRLAVLDNGKPNARLLLTSIAERLATASAAELALVTAKATAATPAEPEILQQLAAADLVVTGSAD
jgi:nucleotide-binding universal stress UspA family protein